MLGNFSFGDYFKRKAIAFAWELFTEVYKLDPGRMYATVYLDDDEAHKIWEEEIGFPSDRIYRLGKKDNYWSMGPTGPNGPCSEIHYDMNPPEGRLRSKEEIEQGGDDAFVELWNLVFMQFNTKDDGTTEPLPNPSIDTGAGLERITAALQGVISNYDTDLFMTYINAIADRAGVNYGDESEKEHSVSCRVIADHLRSMSFLIADGALPSNEGRGYVLRRIIRRAIRHGRLIGLIDPFLFKHSGLVIQQMGSTYPELVENADYISTVIKSEEERFGRSFENSYKYFYKEGIEKTKSDGKSVIPGSIVFKAYDTYGMPIDLAQEIASEHEMTVDEEEFAHLLEGQRQRARASWKGSGEEKAEPVYHDILDKHGPTKFTGYEEDAVEDARVVAVIVDGKHVDNLTEGQSGKVILDTTPFYAESGGQVGDKGRLHAEGFSATVNDTVNVEDKLHVHIVEVLGGELRTGMTVDAEIDSERRAAIKGNHTVTHIIHWALKDILGNHVKQAGSLVEPNRVRFDFTHFSSLDDNELAMLERLVNKRIRENAPVRWEYTTLDQAINDGVTALFGEKYGDEVRVVRTGDFSAELCAGTHVRATGEIGPFHIVSEGSVAAGVRRIEGVTGEAAIQRAQAERDLVRETAAVLRSTSEGVAESARKLVEENKVLQKEVEALKLKLASAGATSSGGTAYETTTVGTHSIAVQKTSGLNASAMKNLADEVRSKIKSGVVLLGDDSGGKATIVLACTDDVSGKIDCGKLIVEIGAYINGGGGGSPTMAQAGGKNPDKIPEALEKGRDLVAILLE
jgi:alanyl-tRNA synthetase